MYDEITKSEDKNQYEAILKKGISSGILYFVCSDCRMYIDDYHIIKKNTILLHPFGKYKFVELIPNL